MKHNPKYYRKIGGQKFTLHSVEISKSNAKRQADFGRRMGFNARIFPRENGGVFAVYTGELKHPEKMTWRNR
jgi:hypothetical protein